jgi:hypothetical protein
MSKAVSMSRPANFQLRSLSDICYPDLQSYVFVIFGIEACAHISQRSVAVLSICFRATPWGLYIGVPGQGATFADILYA